MPYGQTLQNLHQAIVFLPRLTCLRFQKRQLQEYAFNKTRSTPSDVQFVIVSDGRLDKKSNYPRYCTHRRKEHPSNYTDKVNERRNLRPNTFKLSS